MSKVRLLILAVGLLLISNVIFMVQALLGETEEKPLPEVRITQLLELDDEQKIAYASLIKEHQAQTSVLGKQLMEKRAALFENLNAQNEVFDPAVFDEVTTVLSQIEHNNYNHFLDIKGLLHDQQLEKFDTLTQELHLLFYRRLLRKEHE